LTLAPSLRLRSFGLGCVSLFVGLVKFGPYNNSTSSKADMFSIASRVARPIAAQAARRQHLQLRNVQTVKEGLTATDAWNKSCYSGIDYTINEDLPVYDAVQKFAAYNVGCLVTVCGDGKIKTVVSCCELLGVYSYLVWNVRENLRGRQRARLRLQNRTARKNIQRHFCQRNQHEECQLDHGVAQRNRLRLHGENAAEGYSSLAPLGRIRRSGGDCLD
ncbi:hypothetical protein ACHAWF_014794, partial [Thalassiosira exigua]